MAYICLLSASLTYRVTRLFEKPARRRTLVIVADVEPGQRAQQFEDLDVAVLSSSSLELAVQPDFTAVAFAISTSVQYTVDAG